MEDEGEESRSRVDVARYRKGDAISEQKREGVEVVADRAERAHCYAAVVDGTCCSACRVPSPRLHFVVAWRFRKGTKKDMNGLKFCSRRCLPVACYARFFPCFVSYLHLSSSLIDVEEGARMGISIVKIRKHMHGQVGLNFLGF